MPRHLLTGEEYTPEEIEDIVKSPKPQGKPLEGRTIILAFDKESTRTATSIKIGATRLGGEVFDLGQNRKKECPKDLIRVLGAYDADIVMVRTHEDEILAEMAAYSNGPIVMNALSKKHHPFQALADAKVLLEHFGTLNVTLTYIGDPNNVSNSLMLLLPSLGVKFRLCAPPGFKPDEEILKRAQKRLRGTRGTITLHEDPIEAVSGTDAVYTDVWTSMGEEKNPAREKAFEKYQVNEDLMFWAKKEAIFMHDMPMVRGKEVSHTLPDAPCSKIFRQAKFRLDVQNTLMVNALRPTHTPKLPILPVYSRPKPPPMDLVLRGLRNLRL